MDATTTVIDAQANVEGTLRGKDAQIMGRFKGEIEVTGLHLGYGPRWRRRDGGRGRDRRRVQGRAEGPQLAGTIRPASRVRWTPDLSIRRVPS